MSKTKSLHHIVFATKHRQPTIREEYKRELYKYIFHLLKEKSCFLVRLNGMPDHIHMLIDLHPSIALSDLVKHIKVATALRFKGHEYFPKFNGWGNGYYAFSVGVNDKDSCAQYIKNQEVHHQAETLVDEMELLAEINQLQWFSEDLK